LWVEAATGLEMPKNGRWLSLKFWREIRRRIETVAIKFANALADTGDVVRRRSETFSLLFRVSFPGTPNFHSAEKYFGRKNDGEGRV